MSDSVASSNSPHILLVEDEPGLRKTLSDRLRAHGYDVSLAEDGHAGERLAREGDYDVIILDLMLPVKDGLDVCRDLRRDGHSSPVLMLTARDGLSDKIAGLKIGADDYMTKPFESAELLARVQALLRRARRGEAPEVETVSFGAVQVRLRAAQVLRGGKQVHLAAREFKLLSYLVRNPGVVFSRDELLDAVWGPQATPETRTVDVHMGWLRQKLEERPRQPRHLITVYGLGYRFDP
jgi:two-component system alkaline phosphatase synthesis response regulator PhoP